MNDYFSFFPTFSYNGTTATDITRRFEVLESILANPHAVTRYEMSIGDSPERVANAVYGAPYYSWLVLLCGERLNPFFSTFFANEALKDYADYKYGEDVYEVHHLETVEGKPVDDVDTYYYYKDPRWLSNALLIPVTNYEYENLKNDQRRFINLVKPEYLTQIEAEVLRSFRSTGS